MNIFYTRVMCKTVFFCIKVYISVHQPSLISFVQLAQKHDINAINYPFMYFQNYEPNIAICDIGTEFTKMGYATHNSPSFCSNSQTKQNGYVSPLRHSSINNIPSYLQILKNVDRLQTKDILIVLNNEERKVKSKILEFLYENNLCENLLIHESRVCDLYSYGKTTGLVISLSGSINIVAIVDGLVVSRKDEPFGGYDASQMVRNTFDEIAEYAKGRTSDSDYARHIADEKAREIKEHIFYSSNTTYELGKVLNCADVKEEILKCMLKNINKHVNEIVEGMEDDVKYQMLGNIVLTGGCSEINSMVEMVNEAICKIYPQSKVKISYEKKFHTFVGASVFGSLGSTRCFYVGLKDYEEFGVNILDRKAFEWIKQ